MNELIKACTLNALRKETHELVRYASLTFVAMWEHQAAIEKFTEAYSKYSEGGQSFRPVEKALNKMNEHNEEVHARNLQVNRYLEAHPKDAYHLEELGIDYNTFITQVDEHLAFELEVIRKAMTLLRPHCE